jgi:phospholipid transport system substrate-binding protein
MPNDPGRRRVLAGLTAGLAAAALPAPELALTTAQARALIDQLVAEVNGVINSGKSESAMYVDFERIFARYADVPTIAAYVLGPDWRGASAAQRAAFTQAFRGYISRKYGKRFREFIGGSIEVKSAQQVKSFYEVISVANLRGQAPFEVRWLVSDKSGKILMFNIFIEGINMLLDERREIGALLDARRGNLDRLIADLPRLG